MTDSRSAGGDSFDLDKLQQLVEMMEKHDLREVKLRRGDQQWSLRRGPQEVVHAVPMGGYAPAAPVAQAAAPAAAASGAATAPAKTGDEGLTPVKSPMVGTFYASSQPGEPPFVRVGSAVKADTVVCLIEAMKFFNPVKSDAAGTIAKILVKDGDAVEYGQTLFLIQP